MSMGKEMRADCGTDCSACEYRESTGCPGCLISGSKMFWGICPAAACCIEKGIEHCGRCKGMPCAMLQEMYDDPVHGDHGERLANLRAWIAQDGT